MCIRDSAISGLISILKPQTAISIALGYVGAAIGLQIYSFAVKSVDIFTAIIVANAGFYLLIPIYHLLIGFSVGVDVKESIISISFFSGFILFDLEKIIEGKKFDVSVNDYVKAAFRVFYESFISLLIIWSILSSAIQDEKKEETQEQKQEKVDEGEKKKRSEVEEKKKNEVEEKKNEDKKEQKKQNKKQK
eukprot:TRINITY_DN5013_c0_g1_i12.p1 TRINITY_DN5013_c0_g1~~TRINITY_DN5013_c0_g1_i12.p1  ORF type:complete len:191 (-),score=36.59 TRINITY_DN5013_c0_g1_i12:94-666(-)